MVEFYNRHVSDVGNIRLHEVPIAELKKAVSEYGVTLEEVIERDYGKIMSAVAVNAIGDDGEMYDEGYVLCTCYNDGCIVVHSLHFSDSSPPNLRLNGKVIA